MGAEEMEKLFGVTREQLDEWAAPFERGEWPEGETVFVASGWDEFYELAEEHGIKLPPRTPTLTPSA